MRRLFVPAVFAALMLSFATVGDAHAQDALARAKAAGVLQVATEEQFPPYDFIQGGKHVGYNVDLFDEIAKEIGLKVAYTDLPWASILPGLEAKKYDVVAGPAAITAERMKRFRFVIPIDMNLTAIMTRKDDTSIAKSADIAGKKIGAQRASNPLAQLRAYAKTLPNPPVITEYIDYSQADADLLAGRLDGVANGTTNTLYTVTMRADAFRAVMPGFGQASYASFLGRNDADSKTLIDALDSAIRAIKKDGRMDAIQKKWFGQPRELPDAVPALH